MMHPAANEHRMGLRAWLTNPACLQVALPCESATGTSFLALYAGYILALQVSRPDSLSLPRPPGPLLHQRCRQRNPALHVRGA